MDVLRTKLTITELRLHEFDCLSEIWLVVSSKHQGKMCNIYKAWPQCNTQIFIIQYVNSDHVDFISSGRIK